jgi:hypothetical protein
MHAAMILLRFRNQIRNLSNERGIAGSDVLACQPGVRKEQAEGRLDAHVAMGSAYEQEKPIHADTRHKL